MIRFRAELHRVGVKTRSGAEMTFLTKPDAATVRSTLTAALRAMHGEKDGDKIQFSSIPISIPARTAAAAAELQPKKKVKRA